MGGIPPAKRMVMENEELQFKPLPGMEPPQDLPPLPVAGLGLDSEGPVPAGFNERFVAYVIDSLPFVLLARVTLKMVVSGGFLHYSVGAERLWKLMWILLYILYEAAFSSGGRATLGKYLLNIRVRSRDGGSLSFPRALLRAFAYFLSSATFNIGYLMALFTENHRALHDYAAGSRVVSIRDRSDWANGLVMAVSWGTMVILMGTWLNNTVLKLQPSEKRQIITAHQTISKLGVLEYIYMKHNGFYTNDLQQLADLTGNVNAVRAELYRNLDPESLVISSNGRRFVITAKARNWRHTEVEVKSQLDAPPPPGMLP